MKGPIKILMDGYQYCTHSLLYCEKYFTSLSIEEVLLLIATIFVTLFVVLRIIFYFIKDSEIY